MTKLRLLTIPFILFSIFTLTACETQQQRYAKAIFSVFEQIDDVAKQRKEKYPEDFKPHESNDFYYSGLNNIDLTKCPADFQEAFLKYISSFYKAKNLIEEYDNNAGFYKFTDVLSIGASSLGLSNGSTRWDKKETARATIGDAWLQLKQIALRYGVQYKSE